MRPHIIDLPEVRCNFCFNWITGAPLVKKGINSCLECLDKYLDQKLQVHTPTGVVYNMTLHREKSRLDSLEIMECRSIHQEQKNDWHKQKTKRNRVPSISQAQPEESRDEVIFDTKLSSIQKVGNQKVQHMMDFVKAFNLATSKSMLLDNDNKANSKPHQSLIFNTPVKDKQKNQFLSLKKIGKLQDYGQSLDRTRFLERYQYYYDNHTIQEFVEEHPKIEDRSQVKEFGRQILGNEFEQSRSVTSKMAKSHRSKFSNSSLIKSEKKLTEDDVKVKISGFLQSKYHSESLTRIMASYLKQAYDNTNLQNRTMELTNFKISSLDVTGYLNMFDLEQVSILKLVNVGLTDQQLPQLINFIWNKPIESLVLTGNKLTQNCLVVFLNKSLPFLKELYLGNNRISKTKLKENIAELHSKFILYL